MGKKARAIPQQAAASVVSYLTMGHTDYLAARTLLLNDLLLQGAIQASTAVEKYVKALLASRNQEVLPKHLSRAHIRWIRNQFPAFYTKLNVSFLELLTIVYKARYIDNLKSGTTFTIFRRQFLAELDHLAYLMDKSFSLKDSTGPRVTVYGQGGELLMKDNYILNKLSKRYFIIAGEDRFYALRMDENYGLIELSAVAPEGKDDLDFLTPGLIPKLIDP